MTLTPHLLRLKLLDWYDGHARDLPWRVSPASCALGKMPNPYHVWLSEIMLQQTTIATVKPYFTRFLEAFPNVENMALAPVDRILTLWAGLGYYARARNLHACAQVIVKAGGFAVTPEGLSDLPGIGPYTSAAIASIAFDYPIVPVDGNVERVLSRMLRIEAALPTAKPVFRKAASLFADPHRPGDFAQALMDLGSTICTPRNPKCPSCPWQASCLSTGDAERLPIKTPKKLKPIRYGVAFVHVNRAGVLVACRPDKGLLGGMLEVPNTPWREYAWTRVDALGFAPFSNAHWTIATPIRHIFTHFDLRLEVFVAHCDEMIDNTTRRLALSDLAQAALPSVMMKVIKSGLAAGESKD